MSNLADRWVHVCGVMRSRDDMDIYINGNRMSTSNTGASDGEMVSNFPGDDAKIGYWSTNGGQQVYYKGWMDEVRVWDIALTEEQVRNTMCVRLVGDEPGLIGYWQFDEVSGTTIKDTSSKHYDGAIQGGALRGFSGAPVGDESSFIYGSGITEFSWDGLQVKNVTNDPPGIQIYKVNKLPSQTAGLSTGQVQNLYYGVFVANIGLDNNFDIDSDCAFLRNDNSVTTWQNVPTENILNRTEIIIQASASAEVSLGDDIVVCPQEVVLDTGFDPTGWKFLWSTGATSPSIIINEAGLYSVSVMQGCSVGFDEIQVSFLPAPAILLELGGDKVICDEPSYNIDTGLNQDDGTFSWNNGSSAPSLNVTQNGEYKVQVTKDCTVVKDSVSIVFLPVSELNFDLGDDLTICAGEKYELQIAGLDDAKILWNTGEQSKSIIVRNAGIYKVSAAHGCSAGEDSITVELFTRLASSKRFIPNIITPNEDGKNQFFVVQKFFDHPIGLNVFNRWGSKVYSNADYNNDWDGGDVPVGVYFYHLRDECGNVFKGTITVSY